MSKKSFLKKKMKKINNELNLKRNAMSTNLMTEINELEDKIKKLKEKPFEDVESKLMNKSSKRKSIKQWCIYFTAISPIG